MEIFWKSVNSEQVRVVYVELHIISKERTEGGLNKGATFGAPLFSTLLVFPN